jgi:6-pyruvoyltetrahydropterin/6-carboxytetrahydropterin synthase
MKIVKSFAFEAAHYLPQVAESHRCRRLHGHSYRIELVLEGPVDPLSGFVADFYDIETAFAPVLKRLDHHLLNDIPGLENPTAENIAVWAWRAVQPALPLLAAVVVHETADCRAEYCGD